MKKSNNVIFVRHFVAVSNVCCQTRIFFLERFSLWVSSDLFYILNMCGGFLLLWTESDNYLSLQLHMWTSIRSWLFKRHFSSHADFCCCCRIFWRCKKDFSLKFSCWRVKMFDITFISDENLAFSDYPFFKGLQLICTLFL